MKRIANILLFLIVLVTGYAQNPFAAYGYKPKMATLSNGRFDEFHDKDRIVEIGSVRFDTKTNKIVGRDETDTLDSEMDVQTVSRFISIDPHAERYYSISPYVYCNNNPINYIDPDGRDWYSQNGTGNYFWQEGHNDLDGYTNIGSSVSIQFGENSFFNAYQNAGIMSNKSANAFDLIASSGKLQNKFLGNSSPLSENSKSELFNSLVNRGTSEIGRPIGEAITYTLAGEVAGALIGKTISWGVGKIAGAMASKATIQFGNNANQYYHAFRHIDDLGIDRNLVMSAIEKHVKTITPQIVSGKPCNQIINVAGKNIQYTAYKLSNGAINIGRIHGVK